MLKTLTIITLTVLSFEKTLDVFSPEATKNDTQQLEAGASGSLETMGFALRRGMGLIEVERTLNGEGTEQCMSRSIGPETGDPLEWNVGWELAKTYEVTNTQQSDRVTAVFEAWTDETHSERPPESAFRLVRWN
tara:strand:+ start:1154 stop:1555 length:402 start_codon:yes stop_codon:yes gene_type:complete